ncbi:MAG TPA: hypothetical protein VJU15_16690 [Gemmatimonadales bacterium]|nr:hypothetical protein [Gemmatimonadales bacterium]
MTTRRPWAIELGGTGVMLENLLRALQTTSAKHGDAISSATWLGQGSIADLPGESLKEKGVTFIALSSH